MSEFTNSNYTKKTKVFKQSSRNLRHQSLCSREHKLKYLKRFPNRTQLAMREFVVQIKEME